MHLILFFFPFGTRELDHSATSPAPLYFLRLGLGKLLNKYAFYSYYKKLTSLPFTLNQKNIPKCEQEKRAQAARPAHTLLQAFPVNTAAAHLVKLLTCTLHTLTHARKSQE